MHDRPLIRRLSHHSVFSYITKRPCDYTTTYSVMHGCLHCRSTYFGSCRNWMGANNSICGRPDLWLSKCVDGDTRPPSLGLRWIASGLLVGACQTKLPTVGVHHAVLLPCLVFGVCCAWPLLELFLSSCLLAHNLSGVSCTTMHDDDLFVQMFIRIGFMTFFFGCQ